MALLCCVLACAGPGTPPDLPAAEEAPGLRVRLAFGEEADLDLHVTDPFAETIYFAKGSSHSGGKLVGDVRCDTQGERVESVVFPTPPPGRYRIGVDFPIRCDVGTDSVPFVLEVFADGIRHERRGEIPFGRFEPVVYEVDVGD